MRTSSVGKTSSGAGARARGPAPSPVNQPKAGQGAGRGPGGPPHQAGVTLLEMLVVMAILGLMAAISAPSISAGLDSIRMASATQSVASFLNAGLTHCERSQQPVALVIAPKESRLTAYSNEPGFQRELKLPGGIFIEAILPPAPDEAAEPVRRLMLMPGGTVPGIGVQLANSHGTRRIVRLDPMTGFPRVESVVKE